MKRKYNMSNRSQQASQTALDIVTATEKLLALKSLNEINLNNIAKEAKTTVQTVIRHMGSREGCLKAVVARVSKRVEKQRNISPSTNIDKAISTLIKHYELEGKLILNLLAQEHSGDSFAAELTKKGRVFHRSWVVASFAKHLKGQDKSMIDALAASTDIYVWKLLRLDLGRSQKSTLNIITKIVKKILEVS